MIQLSRKKGMMQVVVMVCLFFFVGSGFAASMGGAKIISDGKVIIYNGDQKVGELTAELAIMQ